MNAITDTIRDVVTRADKPMRYYDIAHHKDISGLVVEPDDVHKSLRALIRAGEVEQTKSRAYRATTSSQTVGAEYQEHAPTREQVTPAEKPDLVREGLETAAEATQCALDAYIRAIADPEALAVLVAARDSARKALEKWCDR